MEFQYPFITTGIGSFPHQDEKEVFRLIIKNFPEIPFWPQLPKRSFLEGMVVQYSEGFPSFRWNEKEQRVWVDTSHGFDKDIERFYERLEADELESFRITEDFAGGLRILKDLSSEDHRKEIRYIKGQIVGPITFGLALADQEQKPIFYDPTLRDVLVKHLSMKARWMERKFNDLFPGTPTIIFFDEPSLSSFGSAFSEPEPGGCYSIFKRMLRGGEGIKGGPLLRKYGLELTSFDEPQHSQLRRLWLPGDALSLSKRVKSILRTRGDLGLGHRPNE